MSLLRILASISEQPAHCQWVLMENHQAPVYGEGPLSELPRHTERVQLIFPAAQVTFVRVSLPQGAKTHVGSALAYAIEDDILGEPDTHQVNWMGTAEQNIFAGKNSAIQHIVAVMDKAGLMRWQTALEATGIDDYEVHCEALFLPLVTGEWSVAWDGHEGFVRHGKLESSAITLGDGANNGHGNDNTTTPLSLMMMMEEARATQTIPSSIALYALHDTPIDININRWAQELGIPVYLAKSWDGRTAPLSAGINLVPRQQRWRTFAGLVSALRPAAWIVLAAWIINAGALVMEWSSLVNEQQALRHRMESRFREVFPEAVAVSDPTLQMRRKLSEANAAAGQTDSSHFLPMIEQVATALQHLPPGTLRVVSYENGHLSLELSMLDETMQHQLVAQLLASGLETTLTTTATTVLLSIQAS